MIELKNELKLKPQLILTPQLKLVLKVLQLNILDLHNFLLQEVQSNPFLELEYKDLPENNYIEESYFEEIKLKEEVNFEEELIEKRFYFGKEEPEEEWNWEKTLKAEEKLIDYLLWQINLKELTPLEKDIAYYIIGNLDDKGYLRISLEEIAKEFNVSLEKVEKIRNIIKFLDPVGVASLNLKECLLTQLEFIGYDKSSIPYILVEKHLEEIPKGIDYFKNLYGYNEKEIESALEVIKQLEPYPARNYFDVNTLYIEPDLIFYKEENEWKVEVVKEGPFIVRLNNYYKNFLKKKKDFGNNPRVKKFLKQKLKDAEDLLKALDSRYSNLYKVGEAILKYQKEFLEKGIKFLKPLTLKDVAEEVHLHESTISRIINQKYVQTPKGLFPLKFFFSIGYKSKEGEELSAKAIKDYIREIINGENPSKPLSDSAISKILKEKYGINIARRTVTKYREELQIPSIRERKISKNNRERGVFYD
ncbi:RNA polymerase, sigma 54 subunit, RpoN [Thermodesulfobacterium geofontis OPF15]|jgi:RNA polymerase sigma-54 factor|uniref:RNA polymerase, sigma 54 subunit, RpoN n=1 Tax=Thermodesulfobacterium geofontis (strain OPF15) TaxID=795359 RepID=F8C2R7_THEGP|nr:RNA polymerase factor sigma-54 [Thermodesulfobacterium geofontis]AEH23471.1 RNA polymerase, sigma 54 subunit, RpoN [Thermodesulfobacterium geofontis OPF15]